LAKRKMENLKLKIKKEGSNKTHIILFCEVCAAEILGWTQVEDGQIQLREVGGCPHFKITANKILSVNNNTEQISEIDMQIEENRD